MSRFRIESPAAAAVWNCEITTAVSCSMVLMLASGKAATALSR